MNTYKYSLPILLLSSAPLLAYDPYDHMHAMIDSMRQMSDQMNQTFDEIHRHMSESFSGIHHRIQDSASTWKVSLDEADETILLRIKGIKTNSINVTLDDEKDVLRIKTDEGTIIVYANGKALQVTIRQEQKTEKDEKITSQSVSQSIIARTIGAEIDMEQSNIDYHKEEQELSLAFNKKRRKSKAKTLPVNIK